MQPSLLILSILASMTLIPAIAVGQGGSDASSSEALVLDVHPAAFVDKFELSFELSEADSLVVGVYDRSNRQVYRLELGTLEPGEYTYEIVGAKWEPGSHVVIVTGDDRTGSTNVIKIGDGTRTGGSSILPPLAPNPR